MYAFKGIGLKVYSFKKDQEKYNLIDFFRVGTQLCDETFTQSNLIPRIIPVLYTWPSL